MTDPIPERVAERAATRYRLVESGCHISTYSVGSHGYAQIGWKADRRVQMTTAHRAAWVHANGRQPAATIDHLPTCDRRCVRASHLRELSNAENGRRNGADRDYPLGWTCRRNHGVERDANGRCPECKRLARERWNAANPEKRKAAWTKANHQRRGRPA